MRTLFIPRLKHFFVIVVLFIAVGVGIVLISFNPAPKARATGGVALVGHVSTNGSSTTAALNTTGANMYAVCVTTDYGGLGSNPLSDSLGNTYTLVDGVREDDDVGIYLMVSFDPITSPSVTWTGNFNSGNVATVNVMAFSNVASGPDQKNTSINNNAAGSITPANANELIVSCLGVNDPSTAVTVDSSMILGDTNTITSAGQAGASAYQIQTTATTVNPTFANVSANGQAGVTASFYSTVAPATLAITSTGVSEGFISAANGLASSYSNQLTASGGALPYLWSLLSGTLPAGLSLSSGGLITGTPTQLVSKTPLAFEVKDMDNNTAATNGFTLTVASSSPSITTASCPGGTQYVAYTGCTLVATGGTAPYTFSWNATGGYAALPEGLKLNASTGAITGTVYGQGTYVVQFIATDAAGAISTENISFGIAGDNTLGGCSLFPSNSIFHTKVSSLPVDASPAAAIPTVYQGATIKPFFGSASGGDPNGIPFIRVPWNQPISTVATTLYQSYFTSGPIPSYAPPEGTSNSNSNGDRHVLVLQTAGGGNPCKLWEMWQGINEGTSTWTDSSNAYWPDLSSYALTPLDTPAASFYGTTDAAGLPVTPLLVNYDEVAAGAVTHPIRFTMNHMEHNYVWPATDGDAGIGGCTDVPRGSELSQSSPPSTCSFSGPAGEIYRLKANVATPVACSNDPQSLVIIQAFRDYGIILADNGISGGLIGTPDARWSDSQLSCLTNLTLKDFEPVNVSSIMVNPDSAATIYSGVSSSTPLAPPTPVPPAPVPPAVVTPIEISPTSSLTSIGTLVLNLRSLVIQLLASSNDGGSLTIGSTGTDVWALQVFLSIDGAGPASTQLALVGPTGNFGPITASALAEYQKSVDIAPASGYFGPVTNAYINSHP